MNSPEMFKKLALALPDIPRWVETRSLLLSGRCEVMGFQEAGPLSFVVRGPEDELVSVIGFPDGEVIKEAARRNQKRGAVLAPPENSDHVAAALEDWTISPATIHVLGDTPDLPPVPEGAVRMLEPFEVDSLKGLPDELHEALAYVSRISVVATAIVEGHPVSFCYVASETESLWDISIDTLADYRERGYAGLCVSFLIDYMRERGKEPVWGAEESNIASMKLAAKLGFVPADRLMVFLNE